jgi:hypothetical protein
LGIDQEHGAVAAEVIELSTLVRGETAKLQLAPAAIAVEGGSIVVVGTIDSNQRGILKLTADDLAQQTLRDLVFPAEDVAIDRESGIIFTVGNDDTSTMVQSFDANLEPLGHLRLDQQLAAPMLRISAPGHLLVGSVRTPESDGAIVSIDTTDPAAPRIADDWLPKLWHGSIGLWLDEATKALFANTDQGARLIALDVESGAVTGEISYSSKSPDLSPLAVHGLVGNLPCRAGAPASFLVASSLLGQLSLIEYDPNFRTLNVLAIAPGVISPRNAAETFRGTSVIRPVGLIGSSCDQSVIWLGQRNSRTITQFARGPGFTALDLIGTIDLPFVPTALSVSETGDYAVAISETDWSIARYDREPEAGSTGVLGTAAVRELQRMLTGSGYPVGVIDGMMGPQTRRAIEEYAKSRKIDLPDLNDPMAVLETLQGG